MRALSLPIVVISAQLARADQSVPPPAPGGAWTAACAERLTRAGREVARTSALLGRGHVKVSQDRREPFHEGKVEYAFRPASGRVKLSAFIFTGGGPHPLGATWRNLDSGRSSFSRMLQGANQSEAWISAEGISADEFALLERAFRPAIDDCFQLRPR